MADYRRKDSRQDVHLAVRYQTAHEFVAEYAENLSKGGLFIRGAHELRPLQEVKVEITLPGFGEYVVVGEVAHILSAEMASRCGREAGAGLAITSAPAGFQDAISGYLQRLGRRADATVLTTVAETGAAVAAAGYSVLPAPGPEELSAWIVRAEQPVVGVIVSEGEALEYRRVAAAAGAGEIVHVAEAGLEALLARLDQEL